jgi:regulator of sigma E protease
MTALLVVLILILLIVVHELGHFVMAKLTRVRVDEFGIGYPPRAFILGKWGNTEYTLNWIPFGGFVRLYGDDGSGNHGRGSLSGAKPYVQALILVSGVAANAVLAWVLFTSSFVIGVPAIVEHPTPGQITHLFISEVVPDSPAAGSGITQGDEIKMVTDDKGEKLSPLTPDAMTEFVKERGGKKLTISYQHGDTVEETTMQPANAVVPGSPGRPALGVGLALVADQKLGWPQAMYEAYFTTKDAFVFTAQMLWSTIAGLFTRSADLTQITGPIGLIYAVHVASENGIGNVIKLAAFISVNLAIINLIPIPALDGGKLLILALESMRRKKFPIVSIQLLTGFSYIFIGGLMVAVCYNDIVRIFH